MSTQQAFLFAHHCVTLTWVFTLHDANSSSVLLAMLFFHTGFKHKTAASTIFAEVIHCIIVMRCSMYSMYACPSYWLTCYDACILLYGNPVNPTISSDRRTPTTPTSVPTPSGNTDPPPLTPSGPRGSSTDHDHTQLEGTYVCTCVIALQ